MTENEVVAFMSAAESAGDWGSRCDVVKSRCGGYPPFWYAAIVMSGVMHKVASRF